MLYLLFNRVSIWILGPALFLLLGVAAEAGYRLQLWLDRDLPQDVGPAASRGGSGHILGVSLGLMSLLLSFTFSMAINRYDARRALVLTEANAIDTTFQRADMLPEPLRSALIGPLRSYTQSRIDYYEASDDDSKLVAVERRTNVLQAHLLAMTGQAVRTLPNTAFSALLVDAMNQMFDQATARRMALAAHIPVVIFLGLTIQLIASAVMLGAVLAEHRRRHRLLALTLLALLSFTMVLIIDIDRPREAHVRINQGPLLDLRAALLATPTER